jgi:hypothetical protein
MEIMVAAFNGNYGGAVQQEELSKFEYETETLIWALV